MEALHTASEPSVSAVQGGVLVTVRVGDRSVRFVLTADDAERLAAGLQAEADASLGDEGDVRAIGARISVSLGAGGPALGWLE